MSGFIDNPVTGSIRCNNHLLDPQLGHRHRAAIKPGYQALICIMMQVETPAVDTLGSSMSRSESVSVRGKSLEGLFDRLGSGGDGGSQLCTPNTTQIFIYYCKVRSLNVQLFWYSKHRIIKQMGL